MSERFIAAPTDRLWEVWEADVGNPPTKVSGPYLLYTEAEVAAVGRAKWLDLANDRNARVRIVEVRP